MVLFCKNVALLLIYITHARFFAANPGVEPSFIQPTSNCAWVSSKRFEMLRTIDRGLETIEHTSFIYFPIKKCTIIFLSVVSLPLRLIFTLCGKIQTNSILFWHIFTYDARYGIARYKFYVKVAASFHKATVGFLYSKWLFSKQFFNFLVFLV